MIQEPKVKTGRNENKQTIAHHPTRASLSLMNYLEVDFGTWNSNIFFLMMNLHISVR